MCLPIASTVADVIQSADQQCIVGLLAKMGKLPFIFFFHNGFVIVFQSKFSFFKPLTVRCIRVSATREMPLSMFVWTFYQPIRQP